MSVVYGQPQSTGLCGAFSFVPHQLLPRKDGQSDTQMLVN